MDYNKKKNEKNDLDFWIKNIEKIEHFFNFKKIEIPFNLKLEDIIKFSKLYEFPTIEIVP